MRGLMRELIEKRAGDRGFGCIAGQHVDMHMPFADMPIDHVPSGQGFIETLPVEGEDLTVAMQGNGVVGSHFQKPPAHHRLNHELGKRVTKLAKTLPLFRRGRKPGSVEQRSRSR